MTQVTHNVKFYCNDTAGNINGSESVTFLVDTSIPQIEFVPPTPNNLDLFNENYTYVNVSTSDANNHSAFVDWNNSLVGWWRMDAYNSTGIYDNSSYGNFAVFDGVSASNITTGIRGKGIEFDGSNDYVSINPTDNLILNQGGTISSWIKIAKLGSSYSNTIFMKGDSAGWADLHIELFELTGTDQICLSLSNGSSYLGASCPKSSTLLENTWYHIAASWNSTTKCVFTNGLQSECVQSTIMPENTLTNTVIQLGMTYNSNYPFNGSIDDVMIFNRALSTQEIQALYNAGSYRLYNNFTNLTDGDYTFKAYAYDEAGNMNFTETRTITVDTIAPNVTINLPQNTTYISATTIFNATATDTNGVSACVYSLDNALNKSMINTFGNEWNATNLSMTEGIHIVKFYCNDTAGNINGSESRIFTVNLPPTMVTVKINSTTNASTENIKGYCNATDGDGDDLAYQYQWYNGSTVYFNGTLFKDGSISVGRTHTCGIRANDSRVLCWGDSANGKLGDGQDTINRLEPYLTTDSSAYSSINANYYHTCGIRANDSRVLCWGQGLYGQLGDGQEIINRTSPYPTTDLSTYISISAGQTHTCGIRANDSRVLCWGNGDYGQLGDSSTAWHNVSNSNLTTDISAYTRIDSGSYHTCSIRANDSRVLCWGANSYGQLGDNSQVEKRDPTLTTDTSAYSSISTGSSHTCGLRTNDSRVLCWGYSAYGRLGDGQNGVNVLNPNLTTDTSAYTMVSAVYQHTCGIRANDSRVLCWGESLSGRLGDGQDGVDVLNPNLTTDTSPYKKGFSSGNETLVSILGNAFINNYENWSLGCRAYDFISYSSWMNSSVITGLKTTMISVKINSTTNESTDNINGYCKATDADSDDLAYQYQWYNGSTVFINGTLFKEGTISGGSLHTCGIRANDSRVLCWGNGNYGQLGDGSTSAHNNSNPNVTTDSSAYTSISAGWRQTCGIRTNDSRVLCWGNGDYGQLGDGITSAHNVSNPNLTTDSSAYKSVSAGYQQTCGIRANDSRVLCWGYDNHGQLGDGQTANNGNPNITTDSSIYSSVSAGYYHTCGIRTNDSRVLCWGEGDYGQLGDSSTSAHNTLNPNLTTDSSVYTSIDAGGFHTCGIRQNDSRILCWGWGLYGTLGDGQTSNKGNPNVTTDSSAYSSINSGGGYHTCGIRSNDSRVLCWGESANGRLGDGQTTTDRTSPYLTTDSSPYKKGFSSSEEILVSILGNTFLTSDENWSLSCRAYDFVNYSSWMNSSSLMITDLAPPVVLLSAPQNQGFGLNVTLNSNVTDNNLDTVLIGITPPGESETNYSMINTIEDTYEYNFTSYTNGTYAYRIYANDTFGNKNYTENSTFNLFINLTNQIRTLKDNYSAGEVVNLTDPPESKIDPAIFGITNVINSEIQTSNSQVILNESVKWKKNVKLSQDSVKEIEIPKSAVNVNLYKISKEGKKSKITANIISKDEYGNEMSWVKKLLMKINIFSRGITGEAVKEVLMESGEYEMEYETPGPVAIEDKTDFGKRIVITSEVHYENILAYTYLENEAVQEEIRLYRTTNGSRELINVKSYDKNNNGLIDYIEWTVPHLSEQTYELMIEIM